jgi:hypothetical protein
VIDFQTILRQYNPWWNHRDEEPDFAALPDFQRPIFSTLLEDIRQIPQIK